MANQGNQANQANAQAGEDRDREDREILARSKVPLFRGSGKDTLTTISWCEAVDRQQEQTGWSDARTASAAIDGLR